MSAAYEDVCFAFQAERGLYARPTEIEAAQDRARSASGERTADPVLDSALDELRRQQRERTSWKSGLVILIISLVIAWNSYDTGGHFEKAALIVGILFFHELGHYAAMRLFGYRDLRMFFIPMLGAAVSGRHHNVPGWRKAVVSLMGPVPGIFAGAALGAYAIHAGSDALADAASLIIFLTAFNLLPILPLDGGWFWNAVLFCRHHALEAAFKIVAGLACVGAGAAGLGKFTMYLGIGIFLSFMPTLRQGRIAARLRREGCLPLADGDDTMPRATAVRIIGELRAAAPAKVHPAKELATETIAIFERLNARAPNWLEALGLTAVYFVSLVVAAAGFSIAYVFAHGIQPEGKGATGPKVAAQVEPAHVPRLASEFHHLPHSTVEVGDGLTTLRNHFASFPSEEAAARAFAETRPTLKKLENATQFGPWLIRGHTFQDTKRAEAVAAGLTAQGGTLLAPPAQRGLPALDLRFTIADAETAARVQHDLEVYGRMSGAYRIPAPWRVEPAQQAAVTKAGVTYQRILAEERRAGNTLEVQRLERQNRVRSLFSPLQGRAEGWRKMAAEKRRQANATVQQWLATGAPDLDPDVLQLWLEQPAIGTHDDGAWNRKFTHALTRDDTDDDGAHVETYGCVAQVAGTQVTLTRVRLFDPHFTLPALARYLAALGAGDVCFSFYLDDRATADEDESDGDEP